MTNDDIKHARVCLEEDLQVCCREQVLAIFDELVGGYKYKQAVEECCIVREIVPIENDPKATLHRICSWEVNVSEWFNKRNELKAETKEPEEIPTFGN